MQLISREEGKSFFSGGGISKARLASLCLSLGGILLLAGQFLSGDLDLATTFQNATPLLLGLLGYGVRDAQDR